MTRKPEEGPKKRSWEEITKELCETPISNPRKIVELYDELTKALEQEKTNPQ